MGERSEQQRDLTRQQWLNVGHQLCVAAVSSSSLTISWCLFLPCFFYVVLISDCNLNVFCYLFVCYITFCTVYSSCMYGMCKLWIWTNMLRHLESHFCLDPLIAQCLVKERWLKKLMRNFVSLMFVFILFLYWYIICLCFCCLCTVALIQWQSSTTRTVK